MWCSLAFFANNMLETINSKGAEWVQDNNRLICDSQHTELPDAESRCLGLGVVEVLHQNITTVLT